MRRWLVRIRDLIIAMSAIIIVEWWLIHDSETDIEALDMFFLSLVLLVTSVLVLYLEEINVEDDYINKCYTGYILFQLVMIAKVVTY